MAPHSSTVAQKISWMEEPGRLQSMGSLRVRHDWTTSLSLSTFMHWRRKWQPILAWRIPWTEKPGRLQSMGSHRVGHDWSDLAAAAASSMCGVTVQFGSPSWCQDATAASDNVEGLVWQAERACLLPLHMCGVFKSQVSESVSYIQ